MRALRFYDARQLSVEKVPEPGPPGPGEILLRPLMCGICGTDLHEYTAVAAYGVDRGRLQPGQTVLITGAGPIGSLAAIYALAAGARTVVVSEPDPSRRERASRLGEGLGEVVVADPAAEDVSEIIAGITHGIGADLAIECAGNESALSLCIEAV